MKARTRFNRRPHDFAPMAYYNWDVFEPGDQTVIFGHRVWFGNVKGSVRTYERRSGKVFLVLPTKVKTETLVKRVS